MPINSSRRQAARLPSNQAEILGLLGQVVESPSEEEHTARDHSGKTNEYPDLHDPKQARSEATGHGLIDLTSQQRKVLPLLCQGLTYAAIAERLSLAESTVGSHSREIFKNLGLDDRTQIRPTIIKLGLIDEDKIPLEQGELLTSKQRKVLPLLCQGLTYAAIAERLSLAESTVRGYSHRICETLGVDFTQLRSKAIKLKLIDVASLPLELLTSKQREVLPLLCQGLTYAAIAERLVLAKSTVLGYSHRICEALGLDDRTDLRSMAMDLGLIDEENTTILQKGDKYVKLLSPRQKKALSLLCQDMTDQDIAEALPLKAELVPLLSRRIYEKLSVHNLEQAYRTAIEFELINDNIPLLTESELKIFRLICEGKTRQQVADQLHIIKRTVNIHLSCVRNTLEVETLRQTRSKLIRAGLLEGISEDIVLQEHDNELNSKELEVLRLVCEGMSNKEIAPILGIAKGTVKTHVEHILGKLEVGDRVKACVKALRHGLIEVTPGEKKDFGLTTKETEVLPLLCKGLSNLEIAQKMNPPIGGGTVKTHVDHIIWKLGAHNRVRAILITERNRLLETASEQPTAPEPTDVKLTPGQERLRDLVSGGMTRGAIENNMQMGGGHDAFQPRSILTDGSRTFARPPILQ